MRWLIRNLITDLRATGASFYYLDANGAWTSLRSKALRWHSLTDAEAVAKKHGWEVVKD